MTYLLLVLAWAVLIGLLVARRRADAAEARYRRRLVELYTDIGGQGTKAYLIRKIEEYCRIKVEIEERAPGLVSIIVPRGVTRCEAEQIKAVADDYMPVWVCSDIVWKGADK